MTHVTPGDREELVRRVLRRVSGTRVRAELVRDAVDRVLSALPVEAPVAVRSRVVIAHRESTPDLASRWRQAAGDAVAFVELAAATEGRHTVVAARVPDAQVGAATDAATRLGAGCSVREDA